LKNKLENARNSRIQASDAKREPVKVYSEAWYEQMRPQATISAKKIVDNHLLEVMNTQVTIERDVQEKHSSSFKQLLTRQISPKKVQRSKTP